MKRFIAIVGTLFSCAASWSLPARAPAAAPRPQLKAGLEEYPRSQPAPLAYGKDFFEVSSQNTIRRRFRVWGDYEKELQSYLSESAAVLHTATGHWLLVTVEQVDLYVDILKTAAKPGPPLPAYGYVIEGLRPLVLIKAPPDLPVPSHELGYFRR